MVVLGRNYKKRMHIVMKQNSLPTFFWSDSNNRSGEISFEFDLVKKFSPLIDSI